MAELVLVVLVFVALCVWLPRKLGVLLDKRINDRKRKE
ncbi:hypothetical protein BOA8489_02144 [Boseongicola aestuarii]|uniref:Uncharacterized protein n=1 Tax=Boseongicola aestuarii TaxID=1470561 RepID=A0A238IZY5_9RHOB|nr:hypothetical protein BOA8489_02144 [Boseongicola aestuarii]